MEGSLYIVVAPGSVGTISHGRFVQVTIPGEAVKALIARWTVGAVASALGVGKLPGVAGPGAMTAAGQLIVAHAERVLRDGSADELREALGDVLEAWRRTRASVTRAWAAMCRVRANVAGELGEIEDVLGRELGVSDAG